MLFLLTNRATLCCFHRNRSRRPNLKFRISVRTQYIKAVSGFALQQSFPLCRSNNLRVIEYCFLESTPYLFPCGRSLLLFQLYIHQSVQKHRVFVYSNSNHNNYESHWSEKIFRMLLELPRSIHLQLYLPFKEASVQ